MNEFRFENTVTLTEAQYVAIWGVLSPLRLHRTIRLAAFTALGIIFLFTSYTLLLGVILLGFIFLAIFLPRMAPGAAHRWFRDNKYLRDTLTYGVSEQSLWVKGARMDASVSWSMLVTWRETEGWLLLSPSGIPPVYLSLARLKEEGLYGRVRALAASNAPEYGTSSPTW